MFVLFIIVIPFSSIGSENETLPIDDIAKSLYKIIRPVDNNQTNEQKIIEIDGYMNQINGAISVSPNNPRLWWLKGLNELAYKYSTASSELYKNENALFHQIHMRVQNSYHKSIALNNDYQPHLTRTMLNSIRNTGDSESVVRAIKLLIGDVPGNYEAFDEIEIRGQMSTHLIHLGRYEEVHENIDYMEKNFPKYADLIKFRREFAIKKIEEHKLAQLKKKETELIASDDKSNQTTQQSTNATKPTSSSATNKSEKQTHKHELAKPALYQRVEFFIILLAIGLVFIVYFFRRRKK